MKRVFVCVFGSGYGQRNQTQSKLDFEQNWLKFGCLLVLEILYSSCTCICVAANIDGVDGFKCAAVIFSRHIYFGFNTQIYDVL